MIQSVAQHGKPQSPGRRAAIDLLLALNTETRMDFSRWNRIYETWQRLKTTCSEQIQQADPADALSVQPAH